MNNISVTGKYGEDLACKYLEECGYQIIGRNFRKAWGEIDIIGKDGEVLVFIEVKTIRQSLPDFQNDSGITPEDNLTKSKLKKVQKTAGMFAGKHSELIHENFGWRIDLVAIDVPEVGEPKIRHYKNVSLD